MHAPINEKHAEWVYRRAGRWGIQQGGVVCGVSPALHTSTHPTPEAESSRGMAAARYSGSFLVLQCD
jgi:hypothetical protein